SGNEGKATLFGSEIFRIEMDFRHEAGTGPRINSLNSIQIRMPWRNERFRRTKKARRNHHELNIGSEDLKQKREYRRQLGQLYKDIVLIQKGRNIENRRSGITGREPALGMLCGRTIECGFQSGQERRFHNSR